LSQEEKKNYSIKSRSGFPSEGSQSPQAGSLKFSLDLKNKLSNSHTKSTQIKFIFQKYSPSREGAGTLRTGHLVS
jgi:hypothetical protein